MKFSEPDEQMSRLSKYCPASSSPQRLQSIWFHEKGQNKNMPRALCVASGSKNKSFVGTTISSFSELIQANSPSFRPSLFFPKKKWNLSWGCAEVVPAGVLIKDSLSFASDGTDSGFVGHQPPYESIIFPDIPKHIIYNLFDPIRSFHHIGLPHGTPQASFACLCCLCSSLKTKCFKSHHLPQGPRLAAVV